MRSRAGSWDRKEGSHLQSLDPSRVALLESRSSTTITSAIVVRRLVPLELRRFVLGSGRGCFVEGEVAGGEIPGAILIRRCGDVGGQDCQTFDRDPGSEMQRATDQRRPSQ